LLNRSFLSLLLLALLAWPLMACGDDASEPGADAGDDLELRAPQTPVPPPDAGSVTADDDAGAAAIGAPCDEVLAEDNSGFESTVLDAINSARQAGAGCDGTTATASPPLALDTRLQRSARCHAQQMRDRMALDFSGEDGSTLFDRPRREGFDGTILGGAIGKGSDPAALASALLSGGPSCQNLLSPDAMFGAVGASDADPEGDLYIEVIVASGP